MTTSTAPSIEDAVATAKKLRSQRPWEDAEFEIKDGPRTMLAYCEQALLHWLTREWFQDRGSIIDAGCFLGGSTYSLATGLDKNTRTISDSTRIQTFDLFRVVGSSWEGDTLRNLYGLEAGESFRPPFERELRRYLNRIDIHEGDLLEHQDDGRGDVEILFIDIAKTPNLHDFVMRTWFTRLIPGHSIVVQQDYGWSYYHWGNIAMEVLSDHFEVLTDVPGASRVYLCTKAITPADVERACYCNLWPEDKYAAMEAALNTVRGSLYEPHLLMNMALVAREVGRPDVARSFAQELFTNFPDSPAYEMALNLWQPVASSDAAAVAESATSRESAPTRGKPIAETIPVPTKRFFAGVAKRVWGSKRFSLPASELAEIEHGATRALQSLPVEAMTCPITAALAVRSVSDSITRRCWKSDRDFDPIWKQRINAMATWVQPGVVADYGCGMMWLENVLPKNCEYLPIDIVQRDHRTRIIDLNATHLELPVCDTAFFSGCFEYVDDVSRLIAAVQATGATQIVASYCTRERFPETDLRRSQTWRNNFRLQDVLVKLLRFGEINHLGEVNGNTIVSVCRR